MVQRSFRLSPEALADLTQVAERLAVLDRRPVNQTRALAWAISQAVDAVDRVERLGEEIPDNLQGQLAQAAVMLDKLVKGWRWAGHHARGSAAARTAIETENAALRDRVRELEAELERAKARLYVPPAA